MSSHRVPEEDGECDEGEQSGTYSSSEVSSESESDSVSVSSSDSESACVLGATSDDNPQQSEWRQQARKKCHSDGRRCATIQRKRQSNCDRVPSYKPTKIDPAHDVHSSGSRHERRPIIETSEYAITWTLAHNASDKMHGCRSDMEKTMLPVSSISIGGPVRTESSGKSSRNWYKFTCGDYVIASPAEDGEKHITGYIHDVHYDTVSGNPVVRIRCIVLAVDVANCELPKVLNGTPTALNTNRVELLEYAWLVSTLRPEAVNVQGEPPRVSQSIATCIVLANKYALYTPRYDVYEYVDLPTAVVDSGCSIDEYLDRMGFTSICQGALIRCDPNYAKRRQRRPRTMPEEPQKKKVAFQANAGSDGFTRRSKQRSDTKSISSEYHGEEKQHGEDGFRGGIHCVAQPSRTTKGKHVEGSCHVSPRRAKQRECQNCSLTTDENVRFDMKGLQKPTETFAKHQSTVDGAQEEIPVHEKLLAQALSLFMTAVLMVEEERETSADGVPIPNKTVVAKRLHDIANSIEQEDCENKAQHR